MRPHKRRRDLQRLFEREGYCEVDIEVANSGHFRVAAVKPDGSLVTMQVAYSPSDWRNDRTVRARARREMRSCPS